MWVGEVGGGEGEPCDRREREEVRRKAASELPEGKFWKALTPPSCLEKAGGSHS